MEAFCSYILEIGPQRAPKGSTKSVFLQSPSNSWSCTSLQNDNHQPHFFGILSPRTHSTKWQSSQHIHLPHFSPFDFERGKKTQRHFVEKTLDNPAILLDTSIGFWGCMGGMWWLDGYITCCCLPWHYKMTTLQVLETSTSTKWQPGVVFQLPTLPVQSHSSTTPTQKQHVPPSNKNSPKVCCGERMCIMSPSLTSLKLLYHTWSALLQSFSIFFICSRSCNKHSLHALIFFIHL